LPQSREGREKKRVEGKDSTFCKGAETRGVPGDIEKLLTGRQNLRNVK